MISYHAFIGVCMPFASVLNYSCMIFAYFLFCQHEFALPGSPALLAFLLLVLIIIPIIGQLNPSLVPFLLAYRPYMGNWRFGWYVVHKKGLAKHQKLKTTEDPFVAANLGWKRYVLFQRITRSTIYHLLSKTYLFQLEIYWKSIAITV